MPYHFDWIVPERVVFTRIYGEVSAEEITEILIESRQRTLSGRAPVHFIIDVSAMEKQPFTISKLNEWASNLPDRTTGWWVVINPNSVTMFAITLVSKTLGVKLKSAHSLEDAVQILEKIDQTLIGFLPLKPHYG